MNRRTALAELAAMPLLAALALPGAARAATPIVKLFSLVARRSDIPAERFRMLWIGERGPIMAKSPGIAGLVLSEALEGSAAVAPRAPYPLAFEGMEMAWIAPPGGTGDGPSAATPENLLPAAPTIIDERVSRRFVLREQVVVPPRTGEGAIKRTLLMVRRQGLSHEDFIERWTMGHAKLAQDVPGLLGCVFNRIAPTSAGAPAAIDGIAELWWQGTPGNPGARVASPPADAWMADGDGFTDRERTRVIVSLEHVIIPPPAASGGPAALAMRP